MSNKTVNSSEEEEDLFDLVEENIEDVFDGVETYGPIRSVDVVKENIYRALTDLAILSDPDSLEYLQKGVPSVIIMAFIPDSFEHDSEYFTGPILVSNQDTHSYEKLVNELARYKNTRLLVDDD